MLPTAVTITWNLFQEGSPFDQFWQNHKNHYFSIEKKPWEQQNIHDAGLENYLKKYTALECLLFQICDIHTMLPLGGSFLFSCSPVLRTESPPSTKAHFCLSVFQKESGLCTQSTLQCNTKHGKWEILTDLPQKHSSIPPKNADVETPSAF